MMDRPPSWFTDAHWPKPPEYVAYLARAIDSVTPLIGTTDSLLSPPVQAHVAALGATFEAESGMPLGELATVARDIMALANATNTADVANAVSELVSTGVSVVTSVAESAEFASAAFEVVPVLGQFVADVVKFIAFGILAREQYEKAQAQAAFECQNRFDRAYNAFCPQAVSWAQPRPTGPDGGVTPADLFRPLAYAVSGWERAKHPPVIYTHYRTEQTDAWRPPLNISSVYAALCGYEAGRFPLEWRKRWSKLKDSKIDQATQSKMWRLIRAICASVGKPGIQEKPTWVGDSGRAALTILQEMVRNLYLKGRITDATIADASSAITALRSEIANCDDLAISGGSTPFGGASCSNRVDLATPFLTSIEQFQGRLFGRYKQGGAWVIGGGPIVKLPKMALVLGSSEVELMKNLAHIVFPTRRPSAKKRAVVGTSVATILGAATALAATLL